MQDFHFKAKGYFKKSLKKLPELNEIYNPITKKEQKIIEKKFLTIAEVDYLYGDAVLDDFSLLTDVKLEIGENRYLKIEKDYDDDPLSYFSVHIIYKNGEVIGCLSTRNEPFDADISFPFASLFKSLKREKLYCISPCPSDYTMNVYDNEGDWVDYKSGVMEKEYNQVKSSLFSNPYGMPAKEREAAYSAAVNELVSKLREKII